MSSVYVIGVGQTRFGPHPGSTVEALSAQAITLVLLDAGLARGDLQAAFVAGLPGQAPTGAAGEPLLGDGVGWESCAVAALHRACAGIESGAFEVAVAVGAEAEPPGGGGSQGPGARWEAEAGLAREHMSRFGTTPAQLAGVAAKNHFHGSLNPRAARQHALTPEQVLAADVVCPPLTSAMCAQAVQGAAAVVVCSRGFVARLGSARPVRVRASVVERCRAPDLWGPEDAPSARAGARAYARAGAGPEDVSVAELHDATAYGEIWQTEALGFCARGEGGRLAARGTTSLGGGLPVNTSGGHECRGFPERAGGLAQVHELVTQLRGEAGRRQVAGARIGLAQSWEQDGAGAVICMHMLERA